MALRSIARISTLGMIAAVIASIGFAGTVARVHDGDSFVVSESGSELEVRLSGIDAPEKGQPGGDEARAFLSGLVKGQSLTLDRSGTDAYDRVLVRATLADGTDLAERMVREGWAWCFRKYTCSERLEKFETEAKAAKRGLWRDPSPVPPWDFRAREREARESRANSEKLRPAVEAPFYGNEKSLVFHSRGCSNLVECRRCTRTFANRDEAVAAGFRPGGCCRP